MTTSLIYGCETWGTSTVNSIEVTYRHGLKRSLSVRETTNTEIVYIEANRLPLNIRITKQQLNFWIKLQSYLNKNPNHPLKDLIEQGLSMNLPYLKYYKNLEASYITPKNCENTLTTVFRANNRTNITTKANNDPDSRFGVYLLVNPNLSSPAQNYATFEFERVLLTRYRSGSHNLRIETGRLCCPKIPRENRTCLCELGIQSIRHCLFECPLLREVVQRVEFTTLEEAFNSPDFVNMLMDIERVLKI